MLGVQQRTFAGTFLSLPQATSSTQVTILDTSRIQHQGASFWPLYTLQVLSAKRVVRKNQGTSKGWAPKEKPKITHWPWAVTPRECTSFLYNRRLKSLFPEPLFKGHRITGLIE